MSLFSELMRRNVFRVAAAYVVTAWLLIQVAETIFPLFGLGDAPARIVVIVLAIGFPLFVVFSWVFEFTPEGLRRETEITREESTAAQTGKKLDRIIIVLLAVAVAYFAVDKFLLVPARVAEIVEETAQQARSDALVESYGDKSIAVLPFLNMSSDPEQEYLGDGLAEELLNLLARIPELRVISRSSAFAFKGKDIDIPSIAQQLNVAHVLEGSVRRSGDRIRITAQLIDARSDTHLWSETFDRDFGDIFAIQDDVAARVVEQLQLTLLEGPLHQEAVNPTAYAIYLQARQIVHLQQSDRILDAESLLQRALEIEPDYIDALELLVVVYSTTTSSPYPELQERSPDAIARVLAIDPDNSVVNSLLAWKIWSEDRDLAGAARLAQEAHESDPLNFYTLFVSARLAATMGKTDQAIRLGEYLALRDPLHFWTQSNLAGYYHTAGRVEDAFQRFEIAAGLNPTAGAIQWKTGLARLLIGDPEGALANFEREGDDMYKEHGMALAYHDLGRHAESADLLRNLAEKVGEHWPFGLARAYAWIGDKDKAFEFLEASAKRDIILLGGAATNPLLEKLHEDPRWEPFLESIGQLPEQLAEIQFNVEPPTSQKPNSL